MIYLFHSVIYEPTMVREAPLNIETVLVTFYLAHLGLTNTLVQPVLNHMYNNLISLTMFKVQSATMSHPHKLIIIVV